MTDRSPIFEVIEELPGKISGTKVRVIRNARGMTLEELAAKTGVSPSYISRMESGKRNITYSMLLRFAFAFEIEPRVLIPITQHVPIVGNIGEGYKVKKFTRGQVLPSVLACDNATKDTVALRVDSKVFPQIFGSWVLYYNNISINVNKYNPSVTSIFTDHAGDDFLALCSTRFEGDHSVSFIRLATGHVSEVENVTAVYPVICMMPYDAVESDKEVSFRLR